MKTRSNKIIVIVILIAVSLIALLSFIKGTYSTMTLTEAKEALVNEAYAFYYREKAFNYDDYDITYRGGYIPSNLSLTISP